jgi:peptide deformylase
LRGTRRPRKAGFADSPFAYGSLGDRQSVSDCELAIAGAEEAAAVIRLDFVSHDPTESEPIEPEGPDDAHAPELDAETRERRRLALAQVRRFGDPVLRSPASPVTEFGRGLAEDAERMIALMRDALGVGLAATQLGVMRRLLVFQAGPDATPTAIANPEVEWRSDIAEVAEEGCLSLPGIVVEVERPLHVRVSGRDVRGEPLRIEASGLEARVLQHEVDHLDGVLMVDRAEREQRRGALRALREGTTYSPEPDEPEADSAEVADGNGGPLGTRGAGPVKARS